MLHWQPKSPIKIFIVKIVIVSIFFHLFILFCIFFVSRVKEIHLDIFSNRQIHKSSNAFFIFPVNNKLINKNSNLNICSPLKRNKINNNKFYSYINENKEKQAIMEIEQQEMQKISELKYIEKLDKLEPYNLKKSIKESIKEFIVEKEIINNNINNIEIHNQIYNEISKYWKAPVGIKNGICCCASFLISSKGIIKSIIIEKRSGILAYDISIKSLMKANIKLPRSVWGKKLILNFKT